MDNREQQIIKTGYLGIGVNILVAAGKALVGVAAGSMAIVLDAINNITDALSSVITIVGVKLAGIPADDKHPFGYGRIEYFTAVIIAAMILVAGGTSLVESVKGIFEPTEQDYSYVGLTIIGVSVVVKLILGLFTRRKGKQLSSYSLILSGTECVFDCLVSVSTLVSAGLFMWLGWSLDSWLAAIISLLIIRAGKDMLMSPINELLGMKSNPQLIRDIKSKVKELDGVRGVYDVVLHDYGPVQKVGALHVEVDESLSAAALHQLTRRIQQVIRKGFGMFVTVGFYAHHKEGTDAAREEDAIRQYVMSKDGVLGMHGFYVSHTERLLSFDIVYSFKIRQPLTLRQEIHDWITSQYADYDVSIGLDRNYGEL